MPIRLKQLILKRTQERKSAKQEKKKLSEIITEKNERIKKSKALARQNEDAYLKNNKQFFRAGYNIEKQVKELRKDYEVWLDTNPKIKKMMDESQELPKKRNQYTKRKAKKQKIINQDSEISKVMGA